ncbi:uncharacterized membrane protein (UPF0127 family) [Streptomyces sp. TLI_235]|nr:uncharacterized membrane protein (UPF0127 family) [Streptomyces sp. TLI_235]
MAARACLAPLHAATLCVDGHPVGPVRIATSMAERTRGLLGMDGINGALLLSPASAVHTLGMRFAIDVAYLDRELRVLAVTTMRPWAVGRPRLRARHVLEAEAGRWLEWGIGLGSVLTMEDKALYREEIGPKCRIVRACVRVTRTCCCAPSLPGAKCKYRLAFCRTFSTAFAQKRNRGS